MPTVIQQTDGILTIEVLINGNPIADTVEVIEVSISSEVNRIPTAMIVLDDGGPIGLVNDPFSNSQGSDFIPGNDIEIKLGYSSTNATAFKGIIVSQSLAVKNSTSRLTVICKDKAVKMTKGRYNAIFQQGKDSDAITSIVGNYSGLSVTVDATTPQIPVLMQYNCSDWDFILTRAETNNMAVIVSQNTISVKKYDFSASPAFEINCSQYVLDIDLKLDSEDISAGFDLYSWDDSQQAANSSTASLSDSLGQGDMTASTLSGALNDRNAEYFSSTMMPSDQLTVWGESLVNKAVLSKIQGKISVPGTTSLNAGDLVAISNFSSRFNGNAYISKVSHFLSEGTWITTVHVGRSPRWHASLPDVEDMNASGLIPAVKGVQIGVVKQIDQDPDGDYRVLVTLPVFTGTGQADGVWARLAFQYASGNAGFFFYPEIGDEVLLAFLNNDPRYPVITGALYSTKNTPKLTPESTNQFKAIFSKQGIKIQFDDTDKILIIDTPGGNSFTLDDKNKNIILKDQNGNTVTLENSGITLDSAKDITLTAKNNISLTATSGITLKANQDVKVDGLNVQLNAQVGFTGKGNATAEVSASGQTTVKGAMVMIN